MYIPITGAAPGRRPHGFQILDVGHIFYPNDPLVWREKELLARIEAAREENVSRHEIAGENSMVHFQLLFGRSSRLSRESLD